MSDLPPTRVGRAKTPRPKPPDLGKHGRSQMRSPIRRKGVITIPQAIRDLLDLEEGDEVIITVEGGKVILTPAAIVPRDQMWFWTTEWQAREAEADADLAMGNSTTYDSDEEFLNAIKDA